MNLIRASIDRPVAVMAAVMIAVLFGTMALAYPDPIGPRCAQAYRCRGNHLARRRSVEVEREVVNLQEETLRGLEGLEIMTSRSRTGQA